MIVKMFLTLTLALFRASVEFYCGSSDIGIRIPAILSLHWSSRKFSPTFDGGVDGHKVV